MEECNRNELLLYKIDLTSLRELPWTRRPTTTKEIEFWLHYEIGTRSWLSASYYSCPGIVSLSPTNSESVRVSNFTLISLTPFAFNCDRWKKKIFSFFFFRSLICEKLPKNLQFKISSRILKCAQDNSITRLNKMI